jgi:serine/threonine-protein kinase
VSHWQPNEPQILTVRWGNFERFLGQKPKLPQVSLQVGDLIQDKYRIIRLIGQGGMGAVYEGQNQAIARRVAIKVLHGGLAAQAGVVERFEREAQAAGRIGNDHILEVLDMGHFPNGDRFMVMEYLEGETLEERVEKRGALSPGELYPLVRQLLVGLAAAHGAGIIHRDLKPDNVFIIREKAGHQDFVKIIDFGISKFTALNNDMKMTATGAVMGTPYFMSPEQAKGSRDSDGRSDLYAVGVILYKAVTGNVPFDATTFNELLFKIVLSETPRLSQVIPDIDRAFEALVLRAMAREASQRFQTAQEFIAALDAWATKGSAVSLLPSEATQAHPAYAGFSATNGTGDAPPPSMVALPGGTLGGAHTALGIPNAASSQVGRASGVGFGELTSGLHTNVRGAVTHGTWSNSSLDLPKRSNTPYLLGAAAGVLVLGTLGAVFALRGSDTPAPAINAPTVVSSPPLPSVVKPTVPVQAPVPVVVAPVPQVIPVAPPAVTSAPLIATPTRNVAPAHREPARPEPRRPTASQFRPVAQPQTPAPAQAKPKAKKQADDWGY